MVIHVVRLIGRLFSLCSSPCSFPCVSPTPCSSLPTSTGTLSVLNLFFHWDNAKAINTAPPTTEESCPLAEFTPLTGYEPKIPDDFHYSETAEIIFWDESSDKDAVPSCLFDAELDDETIGRALSSPLFIHEREEPAHRRQAYHSYEESLLPAQSFSVCHSRTGRPVHELSSLSSYTKKNKFSLIPEQRSRNSGIAKCSGSSLAAQFILMSATDVIYSNERVA